MGGCSVRQEGVWCRFLFLNCNSGVMEVTLSSHA